MEAYVQPGVGASDALLDWLEREEVKARVHDVTRDQAALAEAYALGAGVLPVVVIQGQAIRGYDPGRLQVLLGGEAAEGFEMRLAASGELVVERIEAGGLAELAGLKPGDVITELAGYTVFSPDQVRSAISRSAERPVTIRVRRGEDVLTLKLASAPISGPA